MKQNTYYLPVFSFITSLLSLTFIFTSISVPAQISQNYTSFINDKAFVKWAKARAFPLQNTEPTIGDSDLKLLKVLIGDARVVALGEPAHGFHEALSFRNRMFRYLVEKLGFTTIVLEADLAKSRRIADFIAGGPGTAEKAAGALTFTDPTIDDIELLRWMKEYNDNPANKRKVKLYGMDMQLIGLPGDTMPSHGAIDEAISYLIRIDSSSANRVHSSLAPYLGRMCTAKYTSLSDEEHDRLSAALDDLIALFEHQRLAFIATGSKDAYEWAYRNAIVARQTDRIIRLLPPEIPGKISAEAWRSMSARDAAMAENVLWVVNQGEKVFVYGHNAHIKNAPTEGGVWNAFAQPPNAAGQYLRSVLGNNLVIFGISFPSFGIPAQPGSLESALENIGKPRFLLDLRNANTNHQVAKWLADRRPMQANIMTYMSLSTSIAFDAIVYMDKATPVLRIKLE